MWILILPTLIWFSQCIDNKIWVGAFQLGGHLKQQKMDTSCFWKFTKIPKNDQFSCLPNHCKKKKNIAFILYTLYNTDIGMLKLQYLFYNVSICWAMAHLKMSSRWSLWWSSAALLGVKFVLANEMYGFKNTILGTLWPLFGFSNAFSKALIWHKAQEYVLK